MDRECRCARPEPESTATYVLCFEEDGVYTLRSGLMDFGNAESDVSLDSDWLKPSYYRVKDTEVPKALRLLIKFDATWLYRWEDLPVWRLEAWYELIDHIVGHLKYSHVSLALDCLLTRASCRKVETILRPLRRLPELASCSVAINSSRPCTEAIRSVVEEFCLQAIGRTRPAGTFRFLALPAELQLQILEYTDLVANGVDVELNPPRGYRAHRSIADWTHERRCCTPMVCRRWTGATYSALCKCWMPPTAFFLVCRHMTRLAEDVFFRRNHFVIRPESWLPMCDGCDHRVSFCRLSYWLRSYPLSLLHSLKLCLPACADEELLEEWWRGSLSPAMTLRESLPWPKLTLDVCFCRSLSGQFPINRHFKWSNLQADGLRDAIASPSESREYMPRCLSAWFPPDFTAEAGKHRLLVHCVMRYLMCVSQTELENLVLEEDKDHERRPSSANKHCGEMSN